MHRSLRRRLTTFLLPGALALGACAPPPVVYVNPPPDPEQVALALEDKTRL